MPTPKQPEPAKIRKNPPPAPPVWTEPKQPTPAEQKAAQLQAVQMFPPTMPVSIPAGHLRALGVEVDDAIHPDAPHMITVRELRAALV